MWLPLILIAIKLLVQVNIFKNCGGENESVRTKLWKRKRRERSLFQKYQNENKDLNSKLWDFKNRSRQDNLHFDGMGEYENDSWADNEENVEDFLYQRLNIQRVRTQWAHITGKPKDDGPRTILTKFHSFFMIF